MSANRASIIRLQREYKSFKQNPPSNIDAEPDPQNILEWHYILHGPEDTPYHSGIYHGKLIFPIEYPHKPPSILMFTPNGRFQTHTRICTSMSDFHPETWIPTWSVSTILTGLLSFMLESTQTFGSIDTSVHEKKRLALASHTHNAQNEMYNTFFSCEEFKAQKQKVKTPFYKQYFAVLFISSITGYLLFTKHFQDFILT